MKCKNFLKIAAFTILIGLAAPVKSIAAITPAPVSDSTSDMRMLTTITNRVAEIQNMDKSSLTDADKKALRNELKAMKQKADGLDKKVYLSVGAIIIIILLLILLLK